MLASVVLASLVFVPFLIMIASIGQMVRVAQCILWVLGYIRTKLVIFRAFLGSGSNLVVNPVRSSKGGPTRSMRV